MSSEAPDGARLSEIEEIFDRIRSIEAFTRDQTRETFGADPKTLKAVLYDLLVIGEAANRLPDTVTGRHPEIPWHRIRGMRNRLVHAYRDVDPDIVWFAVTEHLDPLRQAVAEELDRMGRDQPDT